MNNLDPRVGFAWDPKGDQKWAVRGGFGDFTQQHAIFTIVKGGVGGRNGLVTLSLNSDRSAVPGLPEHAAGLPAGRGAAGAQHPGDFAGPRERARVDWRVSGSSGSWPRTSVAVDLTSTAASSMGFSIWTRRADPEGSAQHGLGANPNAIVRTSAQADLTGPMCPARMASGTWTCSPTKAAPGTKASDSRACTARRRCPDRVVHVSSAEEMAEPLVLA